MSNVSPTGKPASHWMPIIAINHSPALSAQIRHPLGGVTPRKNLRMLLSPNQVDFLESAVMRSTVFFRYEIGLSQGAVDPYGFHRQAFT
jgi:hypothetical protein